MKAPKNIFQKKYRNKIARTGIPIRKALMRVETEGARQYLKLENNIPTIFILGGSQGSVRINESIFPHCPIWFLLPTSFIKLDKKFQKC